MRSRLTILGSILVVALILASSASAATVIGTSTVQSVRDSNSAGRAEAFKATASAAGTVTTLQVYVDAGNASTKLVAGIYRDNNGHPGALVAQGSRTSPTASAWNAVDLGAGGAVTSGTAYWIAVLGASGSGGTLTFRDANSSTVAAETSSSQTLAALPATWATGTTYRNANLSAYGTTPAGPALGVTPASLSFSGTMGGASPAAQNLAVANTGSGTLSFTVSTSLASWLSVTPASGTAPQSLQVSANTTGLAAGTYTGSVTVTAAGATGSPATIPVTLTVNPPPTLSVTPASLSFAATAGGSSPAAKTLSVANSGSGTVSYTASASSSGWLGVTPASGTAPQTLQVTANTSGLAAGTYSGSITVTAAGAAGSPATIPVTLTVTENAPALSVTPSSLSFGATTGGSSPAAKSLSVTNTGGGSLSFTASASSSGWLSVTPSSGGAPQTLQVSASTGSLGAGTYTGSVTVTAAGAGGSPATVAVTFTVSDPAPASADWLQIDHDAARTGNASAETTISTASASSLSQQWKLNVDGKITAQPLAVTGYTVGGQSRDVVIAQTSGNTVYAVDGATGSVLWSRHFTGDSPVNCAIPGGFGMTAPGAIDRSRGRLYAVSSDGVLRTLSLSDGTDAAPGVSVIPAQATNKQWGGLTLVGSDLYVSTASDGCDTLPFRGAIHRVDVSGATPSVVGRWDVVPTAPAGTGGGGIWGYGGASADEATGHVYGATGADDDEGYEPYADRLVALDRSLSLLGSWEPTHPTNYPCAGQPCDMDFGSTPTVFKPSGCPTMLAAGNKDGNLYVTSTGRLEANGAPEQTMQLNIINDWLGSGGIGGVPAYWAAGRKLFITDSGPGFGGVNAGVVALDIGADCRLTPAWSRQLGAPAPPGGVPSPNSTPTVANGVVFAGEGGSGKIMGYNAATGALLWTSPSLGASVFAAPTVANGRLYAGTWAGFYETDKGALYGFSTTGSPPPPDPALSVAPTSLTFSATTGGASPAAKSVAVSNAGGGTLSFTTSASPSAWLSVTPGSGTAPGSLQVSASTAGLGAGTYSGSVTVTAAGATGSPATVPVTLTVSDSPPPPTTTLFGSEAIEPQQDQNGAGSAEAFQTTATTSGALTNLRIYVDSGSTATKLVAGIYAGSGSHPTTLITQGSITTITAGAWNNVAVPSASVASGTRYWIAVLAPTGILRFRDRAGGCASEASSQNTLTALPATWSTGPVYTDCPLSGFGQGS